MPVSSKIMQENHILILCTVPDRGSGEAIARALVEERLAACVNLVPGLSSTYRWQGKVEQAEEFQLIIKTSGARFEAVRDRIKSLHSYDLPEIIAVPISKGETAYLNWLTESTQ
jgi:periplasmic divalent cation tolerance protein